MKLKLWDEEQIKRIYWNKLHSKEPWLKPKIPRKSQNIAKYTTRFNNYCRAMWYINKDWTRNYSKLVKKTKYADINLNMKDIYKMFKDNEKLIKQLKQLESKLIKDFSDENKIKLIKDTTIIF